MNRSEQAGVLNGVNVTQLHETVGAIRQNPELAQFQFRATTQWKGGGRSETGIQGFHGAGGEDTSRDRPIMLVGDEPPVLLGENAGANAVEVLLHALTSCLTVGFVYNAAARGIRVDALDFEVEGDLDLHAFLGLSEQKRPGYESSRVTYRAITDASREQVVELCEYVQKTSPVLDMLRNPVPVEVRLAPA
ncbi:OsmC family protein [Thioalkalivibrio sp. ALJ24]|uniref:OsmC family protein n=1 Tax=Thioalkalivibrio sp. ALJ24 TaxID=545276 RepID=UPI00039FA42C|nr:OsmC family protein [Thioalkalivibrio sp. ALJ24]